MISYYNTDRQKTVLFYKKEYLKRLNLQSGNDSALLFYVHVLFVNPETKKAFGTSINNTPMDLKNNKVDSVQNTQSKGRYIKDNQMTQIDGSSSFTVLAFNVNVIGSSEYDDCYLEI